MSMCTNCGVAWDHHGTGCGIPPAVITMFEVTGTVVDSNGSNTVKMIGVPICPDLLSIDDMGEADSWRGQVVRGFFHALGVVDRWL